MSKLQAKKLSVVFYLIWLTDSKSGLQHVLDGFATASNSAATKITITKIVALTQKDEKLGEIFLLFHYIWRT